MWVARNVQEVLVMMIVLLKKSDDFTSIKSISGQSGCQQIRDQFLPRLHATGPMWITRTVDKGDGHRFLDGSYRADDDINYGKMYDLDM